MIFFVFFFFFKQKTAYEITTGDWSSDVCSSDLVAKAASGAADTVPVIAVTNLARTLRELKERNVWIVGAETGGESLFDADVTGPVAWVLGAEGAGLRRLTRESCDRLVGIPLQGTVENLNVSVATGVCLYATRRARVLASR